MTDNVGLRPGNPLAVARTNIDQTLLPNDLRGDRIRVATLVEVALTDPASLSAMIDYQWSIAKVLEIPVSLREKARTENRTGIERVIDEVCNGEGVS